jgi:hypothetical protein
VQNQLHDVARFKPMTATATAMVKSVWQAYFRPAAKAEEAPAEGEAAKASWGWALEGNAAADHFSLPNYGCAGFSCLPSHC